MKYLKWKYKQLLYLNSFELLLINLFYSIYKEILKKYLKEKEKQILYFNNILELKIIFFLKK